MTGCWRTTVQLTIAQCAALIDPRRPSEMLQIDASIVSRYILLYGGALNENEGGEGDIDVGGLEDIAVEELEAGFNRLQLRAPDSQDKPRSRSDYFPVNPPLPRNFTRCSIFSRLSTETGCTAIRGGGTVVDSRSG